MSCTVKLLIPILHNLQILRNATLDESSIDKRGKEMFHTATALDFNKITHQPDFKLVESEAKLDYLDLSAMYYVEIRNCLANGDSYKFKHVTGSQELFNSSVISHADVLAEVMTDKDLAMQFSYATRITHYGGRCKAQDDVIKQAIDDLADHYSTEEAIAQLEEV